MTETAPDRLARVLAAIETAARESDRDPADITLIAVSKTFGADAVRPVLDAGHRVFGENKVQEAEDKWPALKDAYPDSVLHLIGPLQSNKARRAVEVFDVIQTVDRPKLARGLARLMEETGCRPDLYVQVNTGEEDQKAGIAPADIDVFVGLCRDELALPVVGLMCIPPVDDEASLHFALLADMAARLGLPRLSMGMSADFETAVAFGATDVRVGSAVFGPRD